MTTQIALRQYAQGRMLGMRSSALPLRQQIERALVRGEEVSIDFSGVEVTQSFVDELLGSVIRRRGVDVMRQVLLKGCSPSTRGIVRFVAADRSQQFLRNTTVSGHSELSVAH